MRQCEYCGCALTKQQIARAESKRQSVGADQVAQIREALVGRIHALANRGANICEGFRPKDDGGPSCARCGYQADVHLLRDVLSSLSPAPDARGTWQKIANAHPEPGWKCLVRREGWRFVATPCYGMHSPWWVSAVASSGLGIVEAEPVSMRDDDEWIDLDALTSGYEAPRSPASAETEER